MEKYFKARGKNNETVSNYQQLFRHKLPLRRTKTLVLSKQQGVMFADPSKESFPSTEKGMEDEPSSTALVLPDPNELDPNLIKSLQGSYLSLKLRRLMAVELAKNRIKGDLKKIVKQIDSHVNHGIKDFVVLGGGARSLNFLKIRSKPAHALKLQVDVRGYIPDNICVSTTQNRLHVSAKKVNGMEKGLGILAPSARALEGVEISPPENGFLTIQFPEL